MGLKPPSASNRQECEGGVLENSSASEPLTQGRNIAGISRSQLPVTLVGSRRQNSITPGYSVRGD